MAAPDSSPANTSRDAALALAAAALTGFSASLAQVIVLRELLVLFSGNELSMGIVLAAWLICTAAGSALAAIMKKPRGPAALLLSGLAILALLIPGSLAWIRAARPALSLTPGEILSLTRTVWVSLIAVAPVCLTAGYLFPLAWFWREKTAGKNPVAVYLAESLGAAAGGLAFYFLVLPNMPVMAGAVLAGLILGAGATALAVARRSSKTLILLPVAAGILSAAGLCYSPALENLTRTRQWGNGLVEAKDTPYNNLALVEREGQYTLFANGLWAGTAPDPMSAEYAAHPALLNHPEPERVAVLGAGAAGVLTEILKHPHIQSVDYVELDPEMIAMIRNNLPPKLTAGLRDPRVNIVHKDPRAFIRDAHGPYDVVLMNLGDPLNAGLNRMYTLQFYLQVRRILAHDGVLSFAAAASEEALGPAQAEYLRSHAATLEAVFPEVTIYPGTQARFIAADRPGFTAKNPQTLITRLVRRGLDLDYVREYYITDQLSPMRLGYMNQVLADSPKSRINRDFSPTCYYFNLVLWGAKLDTGLKNTLMRAADLPPGFFWSILAAACIFPVALFFFRPRKTGAVALCTACAGGTGMLTQIALILGFQVLQGYVYSMIALLISLYMAGLGLGAALGAKPSPKRAPLRALITAQTLVALLPAATWAMLLITNTAPVPVWAVPTMFCLASGLAGTLGGAHYALAVRTAAGTTVPSGKIGGAFYALDLVGAAMTAAACSMAVIPLYGLARALGAAALINLACLVALIASTRFKGALPPYPHKGPKAP